jgi:undecaprenyl-diphosphatase
MSPAFSRAVAGETSDMALESIRRSGSWIDVPRARRLSSPAPVLGRGGRLPARLAGVVGPDHPVRTFLVGIAVAFVFLAALSILLGLLLVHVLAADSGIAHGDESFVETLARHRSSALTDASLVGSIIAGGVVLPIVAGLWAFVLALFKQWRVAAFIPFALGLESAVYRTTTLAVHRDRPAVHRLEHLPVNASYPSGHTAAAIAVYCGIALLVTSRFRNSVARALIWMVALSIPPYVALARMYRGMHHPLDVAGGVVIGALALVALVVICRATGIAVAERGHA